MKGDKLAIKMYDNIHRIKVISQRGAYDKGAESALEEVYNLIHEAHLLFNKLEEMRQAGN